MFIQHLLVQRGYSAAASDNGSNNGGGAADDKGGNGDKGKADDRGDDVVDDEEEAGAKGDEDGEDDGAAKDDDADPDKGGGGDEDKGDDGEDDDAADAKDAKKSADGVKKDDKGKKEPKIPKSRFDEAVARERAKATAAERTAREAQDRVNQLTKAEGTPEKLLEELEALEDKLDDALADGNKDKVKELRTQIRKKNTDLVDQRTARATAHASQVTYERVRYDEALKGFEAAHSVINPDHEDYDEAIADEVLELLDVYQRTGTPPSEALQKAVKLVLRPAKGVNGHDASDKADKAAGDRKAAAVKKGAEAAGKQPASMRDSGKNSDKLGGGFAGNVAKLSDKDFDELPEDTKRRLRGDIA